MWFKRHRQIKGEQAEYERVEHKKKGREDRELPLPPGYIRDVLVGNKGDQYTREKASCPDGSPQQSKPAAVEKHATKEGAEYQKGLVQPGLFGRYRVLYP